MTTTESAPAQDVLAPVAVGTVQVWSDLLDPFTHLALHRLRQARRRLGLALAVEHRSFALELFDGPHPRRGTDTEAVGVGQAAPELEWRVWTAAADLYPHTVLLAAEAVQAAQAQSLAAGEALDHALRRGFWTGSRSVAHRDVIVRIATEITAGDGDLGGRVDLDVDRLVDDLDAGRHRHRLAEDYRLARTDAVPGSAFFRFADHTALHNPGTEVTWAGPWAAGFPVVTAHDPAVFDPVLRRLAEPGR